LKQPYLVSFSKLLVHRSKTLTPAVVFTEFKKYLKSNRPNPTLFTPIGAFRAQSISFQEKSTHFCKAFSYTPLSSQTRSSTATWPTTGRTSKKRILFCFKVVMTDSRAGMGTRWPTTKLDNYLETERNKIWLAYLWPTKYVVLPYQQVEFLCRELQQMLIYNHI